MTPVFVKVCGMTRREDAELAVELGAGAIGFILWPRSPRAITVGRAKDIAALLPSSVDRVGVFVNASVEDIRIAVDDIGLTVVQLHGDEEVDDYVPPAGTRVWKSVSLVDEARVDRAAALPAAVVPLVDANDPVRRGGTGQRADWLRAARLSAQRQIVLAGGLNAANVGDALRDVRPWGLDVSSGVERTPGIKDAHRLREFFAAVAGVRAEGV